MEKKRLNKFISDSGFCSRREADTLLEQGRVTVNDKIPTEAGMQVTAKDKVRIDDQIVRVHEEKPVFLLFNKPAGISTNTDPSVRNNIIAALNYPASLVPIGLLDRDAEGVMFLSNDNDLARRITKADNRYEKEYVVLVDKLITPDFISKISQAGGFVPGEAKRKNFVEKKGTNRFRIILEPGMNHHLKRMVEELGYKIVHLQRLRVGDMTAGKLPVGHWRALSEAEVESIKSVLSIRNRKVVSAAELNNSRYSEKSSTSSAKPGARTSTKSAGTDRPRPARSAASSAKQQIKLDNPKSSIHRTKGRKASGQKPKVGGKPAVPSGGRRSGGNKQ